MLGGGHGNNTKMKHIHTHFLLAQVFTISHEQSPDRKCILVQTVSSRIVRSRKIFNNLSKSSTEFEPDSFLMSVFCKAKSDAVVLVGDTGDIGWGYGLLPAGKGIEVIVRDCVLLSIKA